MTTPFPFQAGSVLPAQSLNDITNLPINDQTASYTLVVGDAGKRVVMNVATANTVTVNDSVFTTGDTIFVANKGAGAVTLTAGAGVTINSASGLDLVTSQSGQLVALSASSFLFVASDVTASAGGLIFINGQSFTTVTSVSLAADSFTSTFDNYRIMLQLTAVTNDSDFTMRLRAAASDNTTSNYRTSGVGILSTGSAFNNTGDGQSSFKMAESNNNAGLTVYSAVFDVLSPKLANNTIIVGHLTALNKASSGVFGVHQTGTFGAVTQFDSLTFISSVASSITGFLKVYGYANS